MCPHGYVVMSLRCRRDDQLVSRVRTLLIVHVLFLKETDVIGLKGEENLNGGTEKGGKGESE